MDLPPEIACTYASHGPTGVFNANADASHMLTTPFAQPSWEPRFAVDSRRVDPETITRCLELFLGQFDHPHDTPNIDLLMANPSRLVMAPHGRWEIGLLANGRMLARDAAVPVAARLITDFLHEEAVYPPRPWFDGGENKGFQAYDVPYNSHPIKLYGFLVIEPKWFECHK